MVLQRRLDCGFNGYQVPPTPRATRSIRKRSSFKKTDETPMCAFDLLATVAGNLLVEDESVKKEQQIEDINNNDNNNNDHNNNNCLKSRTFFVSEIVTQAPIVDQSVNDASSGFASALTYSDSSERICAASKLLDNVGPSGSKALFGCKLEEANKTIIKIEPPSTKKVPNGVDKSSSEETGAKFSAGGDLSSFPVFQNDVKKLVKDDDDENSSGCTQPSTPNNGNRRIKKILASKCWKAAPRLKDEEPFDTDEEMKSVYRNRNSCYKRQRSLRDYPFKKRRLFDHGLESISDGAVSSDAISSSPEKRSSLDAPRAATGPSGYVAVQHASSLFKPKDSNVKLKIKSFRVPELFVEISETSTVGSLKRTVLDAATAILSGGLRVGVILQGKKVRDDSKTLLQAGISQDNKLDSLGFTLEPNSNSLDLRPLCPQEHHILPPCEAPKPLGRFPLGQKMGQKIQHGNLKNATSDTAVMNLGSFVESDDDSTPLARDMLCVEKKSSTESRALVPFPAKVEPVSAVPVRKLKRSDVAQRRIRRPFSVSEVEALVQAVEKLGTGRWRDVKLRAFDNAKHRTYVDLKDKWKTLVHTARISPQQRRGEPVPQELLDRVLTAHAYWSQQQAKQQSEACLLL